MNWDNPGPRAKRTVCQVHCRWPSAAARALDDLVRSWDRGDPDRIEFQVNCPFLCEEGGQRDPKDAGYWASGVSQLAWFTVEVVFLAP